MPVIKRHLGDPTDSFIFDAKKSRLEGSFDFSNLSEEVSKLFNEIKNEDNSRESSINSKCCNDGSNDNINSDKVENGTVGNEICVAKAEISKKITFKFTVSIKKRDNFSFMPNFRFFKNESTSLIKHELYKPMNAIERFCEDVRILSREHRFQFMNIIIIDMEKLKSPISNAMKMLNHCPIVDNKINFNNDEVDGSENKSINKECHTNDDNKCNNENSAENVTNNVVENVTNNNLNYLSVDSGNDNAYDSFAPREYTVEVNGQKVWAFFDTYANDDDFEPVKDIDYENVSNDTNNRQKAKEVFVTYNNSPVWAFRDVYEISNSDEEDTNAENCIQYQYTRKFDDELSKGNERNVNDIDDDFESEFQRLNMCVFGLTETQTDTASDH